MVEAFRVLNPCVDLEAFLHQVNWDRHAARRQELHGHLHDAQATVADPDFAIERPDGSIHKYRKGFGTGRLRNLYLLVIEERHSETLYRVVSAYFTAEIRDGTLLCLRRLR